MRTGQVFVSHTSDMAQSPEGGSYVEAVLAAVNRAGMAPVDMRYFTARDRVPAEYCRLRVRECEIYVAVVGFRYGSVVPGETVSYTEMEFDEATAAGVPRLVFLLADTASTAAVAGDADRSAVDGFRQRLRDAGMVVGSFSAAAGLELEVFHALTEVAAATSPAQSAVPRQLPAAAAHFVGRAAELAALDGMAGENTGVGGTVVISAIGGTAGVGKTALALRWAHMAKDRFPDGQLYVNLRGFDAEQPVQAGDALAGFLRALGVAGADIPPGTDERAAAYRSLLAGRRMLVVLDNAGSADQARPLLPASPACAVVVTSRDALPGLVARDGARRLQLDLLPPGDAVALLRELIGVRVGEDPDAAAALAGRCARLPLALRIAAELAISRPAASIAQLASELADQQRLLDLLDAGGDPRTAVRAVFWCSYQQLPAAAARTFRLLGLHPGASFDAYAAAALTGTTLNLAQPSLDLLARASLIQPAGQDRYGMHDLLRAYARDRAAASEPAAARHAALTRLFDYYLAAAAAAMDTLVPGEKQRRPHLASPATPTPELTGHAAANAWLDTELDTLVAVAVHTATHGYAARATHLAAVLARYLDNSGHFTEAITIHTHALRAARDAGDPAAEADALAHLGTVDWEQGRYQQAVGRYQQALALYRQGGHHAGAAFALTGLGHVDWHQGRYQQAHDHYEQALALYRRAGYPYGEASALSNLGTVSTRQGRYQQATGYMEQALTAFHQTGDRTFEAYTLSNLAEVTERQGRYQQASSYLAQALAIFTEIGDQYGQAWVQANLGTIDLRQGRHQQATSRQQQALDLFRQVGDRHCQASALNNLGEALLAAGEPGQARTHHASALHLARQLADQYEQARAHSGLAHAHHATGDLDHARHHARRALSIHTSLAVPDAVGAQAHLAEIARAARAKTASEGDPSARPPATPETL